jgi:hypothetical protein
LLYALPAVAILVSPLARETVFNPRSSNEIFSVGMAWAFIGQAIVGAILLTAAARKFRQPDQPAFSISLSLSLLAAWVVLNLVGMLQWAGFEPEFLHYVVGSAQDRLCAQFTGSLLTSLLLCLLPLSAAIRRSHEVPIRGALSGARSAWGSFPLATLLACAILLCMLIPLPGTTARLPEAISLRLAISITSALAAWAGVLTIGRTTPRKAAPLIILFIFATWFIPLLTDVIEHSVVLDSFDAAKTPWSITAFGPIGTAISPWNLGTQTSAGLYCQAGIAAFIVVVAILTERRRSKLLSADPKPTGVPSPFLVHDTPPTITLPPAELPRSA